MAASEQDRPDVKDRREEWKESQGEREPDRLVFPARPGSGEHGADPGLGAQGERLKGKAPFGHWNSSTLVAAQRRDRSAADRRGPIDGASFLQCVEKDLAPTLKPGGIVVMDSPSCRKGEAVRRAIGEKGAELRFLPPCSPDPNPIGQTLAKLKHRLRQARERDREALREKASGILGGIEPGECSNYLGHAGYCSA